MNKDERALACFGRRLTRALTYRYFLASSTVWVFVWGAAALVLRVAFGVPQRYLLTGMAGFLVALVLAVALAVRRRPPKEQLRAMLDCYNRCGGLLMAARQVDLGSWTSSVPGVTPLRPKWRGSRVWHMFLAGCLFAAVSLLLPHHYTLSTSPGQLEIGDLVDELESQIQVLAEENILEEKKAKDMTGDLARIWAESSAEDPVKSLEAMDHVAKAISDAAAKAAQEALSKTEELSRMRSLAEALDAQAKAGDKDKLTQAMKELGTMVDKADLARMFPNCLNGKLLDACSQSCLTPEQLKALAKSLRMCEKGLMDKMGKLCEARLIDPKALQKCSQAQKDANAALAAFLAENEGTALAACLACMRPGRGGIDRGRGDAPLTWTDASDESGTAFKEKMLSPASLASLKKSRLVGVSASAPEEAKTAGASASGALAGAAAGGGSAHTHQVLPKHRGTVSRYFQRKE